MLIRPATMADFPGIDEVSRDGAAWHAAGRPDIFHVAPQGPYIEPALVEDWIAAPDALLLVAEVEGRIDGLLVAFYRSTIPNPVVRPSTFVMVDQLLVREGQRGRGLGHALMSAAHAWARQQGAHRVLLNVWEFNQRAIHFYEGLGYHTAYRRLEFSLDGEE